VADDDREQSEGAVSRRAFLKGGAAATGALSATLIPGVADAQLPLAKDPDPRTTTVELKVNGVAYRKEVPNNRTLVEFIREDLKLTGTKVGCDRGMCGACTVIVNGRNVYSCMTAAVEVSGADVMTIEGLGTADTLHPIQQAFIEKSGFQCGFCTSGQIMSTKALLDKMPRPSEDDARLMMSGNLCRCSAYKRILESVMTASRMLQA
jgi:aerobic-type carbon monoxide dehydrogenase small subunit (CoxS/CutS family)